MTREAIDPMTDLLVKAKFDQTLDRARIAADWRARGYSCELFVDPPGREWTDFVHGTNELVAVVEGRLEMTIDGTRLVAEPGDEVFIPRRALHSVKNIHGGTTRWLYGYD
jgi:mannose-6-phosphate isomerase-like protein (cupin superfamily)